MTDLEKEELAGAAFLGLLGVGIATYVVYEGLRGSPLLSDTARTNLGTTIDNWPAKFVEGALTNAPLYGAVLLGTLALSVKVKRRRKGNWSVTVFGDKIV